MSQRFVRHPPEGRNGYRAPASLARPEISGKNRRFGIPTGWEGGLSDDETGTRLRDRQRWGARLRRVWATRRDSREMRDPRLRFQHTKQSRITDRPCRPAATGRCTPPASACGRRPSCPGRRAYRSSAPTSAPASTRWEEIVDATPSRAAVAMARVVDGIATRLRLRPGIHMLGGHQRDFPGARLRVEVTGDEPLLRDVVHAREQLSPTAPSDRWRSRCPTLNRCACPVARARGASVQISHEQQLGEVPHVMISLNS